MIEIECKTAIYIFKQRSFHKKKGWSGENERQMNIEWGHCSSSINSIKTKSIQFAVLNITRMLLS